VPSYPPGENRLVDSNYRGPKPDGGCRVYVLDLFGLPEPERREALEALAELVGDPAVLKIGHNLKFDLAFLRAAVGRRIPMERLFDTMLASQLAAAGDHVIHAHLRRYCRERGLAAWISQKERQTEEYRCAREESGATEGTVPMRDAHGHWILWEPSRQQAREEETRPWYPTHSLRQVAHRHLEVWMEKEYQAADWGGEVTEEMVRYAARDAAVLLPLYEILAKALNLNGLHETAVLEFACLPATVEVELAGMPFDAGRARGTLKQTEAEAARRKEALAALAEAAGFRPRPKKAGGRKKAAAAFNPDSAADLADFLRLLAEREGLLAEGGLAVGGEQLPLDTTDETLARLAARLPEESAVHRFTEELRAYRAAKKRADFLADWLNKLHPTTDRLHPKLRQLNPNGVGRFSAREPNTQQVGRGSDIRSLFRAPKGRKLAVADYSGIEMRIMAQLSKDENLLAAFREGADVHRRTAAYISGKREDEVTKEERQAAKAAGFGLIYGMTAETLRRYAETSYGVKLTPEEAERMREAFFGVYRGVAEWQRRQDSCGYPKEGRDEYAYWTHDFERGFRKEYRPCVRTLGGRLRVWPAVERERRDGNGTYFRKAGAFTELYNTPDQGTGADMLKCAMARLYREFLRRGWEDVRLVATVHDELVLEAPEGTAEEAAEVLKAIMKAAGARFLPDVPVEVEAAVCESWAEK
jgi:DNA polymerase-1